MLYTKIQEQPQVLNEKALMEEELLHFLLTSECMLYFLKNGIDIKELLCN